MPLAAIGPAILAGLGTGAGVAGLASGVGAAVAGGLQAHSANKGAKAQADAAARADAIQQQANDRAFQLAQEQQTYDRWLQGATAAARQPFLDQAAALAGGVTSTYNPAPFQAAQPFVAPTMDAALNDPGFQAQAAQAQKGIEHSAAARGTLLTGGTGEAIAANQADLAANRYADVFNRAQSLYGLNEANRLTAYNINNQNAYNAAQLNQSASLARINELLSLAGLASPGQYPGPGKATTGQGINEGGAVTGVNQFGVPTGRQWVSGMQPYGGDPSLDPVKGYVTNEGAAPAGTMNFNQLSNLYNTNQLQQPGMPLVRVSV